MLHKSSLASGRRLRLIVLVVLVALLVQPMVAFGQGPAEVAREETLIMGVLGGIGPAPQMHNPFNYSTNVGMGLHQLQIESLFYLNFESGEIEPWLATGWSMNEDFTELTLNLREGVKWSDGEAFTANDVVFTLNMLQEYAPALWHSEGVSRWVESVEAVDDLTVKITMKEPNPRYIYNFIIEIYNSIPTVPEHIWADVDPTTFTNFDLEKGWPVFTGPYRLVQADENQLIYDRRDDWWGAEIGFHDLPAPKRVVMVNPGPEERAAAAIEANEVDVVPQMGLGAFQAVIAANPNIIAWETEPPYGWYDTCPHRLAINNMAEPWDDPEMRKALSLAIDTVAYANVTTEGRGVPARWLYPPYPALEALLDANQDLFDKYEVGVYDPERALEIFASKGYTLQGGRLIGPDGQQLTVDLLMMTPESGGVQWGVATTFFTEYLNAVGIAVNARAVDFSVFEPDGRQGLYDIRLMWTCGSVVDPVSTLLNYSSRLVVPIGETATGDNANTERWVNEEYTAIVERIATLAPDDPEVPGLLRQALDLWLAETPAIPLAQQPWIIPFNTTYWTNWPTAENNYFHPPVWWQSALQIVMNLKPAQ